VETGLFDTTISSVFLAIIHNYKPGENNRVHSPQVTRAVDNLTRVVKTYWWKLLLVFCRLRLGLFNWFSWIGKFVPDDGNKSSFRIAALRQPKMMESVLRNSYIYRNYVTHTST